MGSEMCIRDRTGATSKAQTGDTFSFATGTKTFLDHRDENGNVVNITYTGGTKDSDYYVGNETKLSGFLSASKDGTKELGDAVNTIIDLRDSFKNTDPSLSSQAIEDSEKKLISQEETLIDKMGELSSRMVRMNTVRAHDEDYFMQLDQRISLRSIEIERGAEIPIFTESPSIFVMEISISSPMAIPSSTFLDKISMGL